MSKDRSLGDFVGERASESAATTDVEADPETLDTESDDAVDTDTVEPATPTYRYAPDGAPCDACGATVEKRWHDDGQFVCAECKDW